MREGRCELVSGERSGPVGLDVGMGEMLPSVEVTRALLWWLSSVDWGLSWPSIGWEFF